MDALVTFQACVTNLHGSYAIDTSRHRDLRLTVCRDKKPDWSRYYSGSDEIRQYLEDVTTRHDLYRFVKLNQQITKAEWLSGEGKWKVTVLDSEGNEFHDYGEFFINGGGVLK